MWIEWTFVKHYDHDSWILCQWATSAVQVYKIYVILDLYVYYIVTNWINVIINLIYEDHDQWIMLKNKTLLEFLNLLDNEID